MTPHGRGAVAVLTLMGPEAESALDILFQPANGRAYAVVSPRQVVYGVWIETGEDVVVFRRGREHFEIHCHGGRVASDSIMRSLEAEGVGPTPASRAVVQRDGRWSGEVQVALAQATTDRTARLLLDALDRLPSAIGRLVDSIKSNRVQEAIDDIGSMLKWAEFGLYLSRPRSVVLCGKPNVGKSSLINALVGFQRAIVHDVPGTTRDVVTQSTALDGWPVELMDTAGLREETADSIETIGVRKAEAQIEMAQVTIVVFDASTTWTKEDADLVSRIEPDLVVFNKADKAPGLLPDSEGRPGGLATSATTGAGVESLIESLGEQLVRDLPESNQSFPISEEQVKRFQNAIQQLKNGQLNGAIDTLDPRR